MAAVALVVTMAADRPPAGSPADRAGRMAVAAMDAEPRPPGSGGDAVGIDQLPMFDEIEDGLVESVAALAVSLLDVPDLTMLAGWDANDPAP